MAVGGVENRECSTFICFQVSLTFFEPRRRSKLQTKRHLTVSGGLHEPFWTLISCEAMEDETEEKTK